MVSNIRLTKINNQLARNGFDPLSTDIQFRTREFLKALR